MAGVIVFDAGALIGQIDDTDPFHAAAFEFIEDHAEQEFVANALTLAETLVRPARAGQAGAVRRAIEQRLGVTVLGLTADDAGRIAAVRDQTSLRMPDAVVVATAEIVHAALVTTDARLAAAAGERGIQATLLDARDGGSTASA